MATAYVVAAVLQRAAPFVLLLLMARSVSVETFGEFSVLTAIFTLTVAVAGFGLESAAFRGVFAARGRREQREFYSALSKLSVGGPAVVAGAAVLFGLAMGGESFGIPAKVLVATIVGGALFAAGTTLPLAKMRAEESVRQYIVCTISPALLQVAVKILLCLGLEMGAWGWALGDLVAGAFVFMLTARHQVPFLLAKQFDWDVTSRILRLGLPLLPHTVSSWVLNLSDRLLVASFVGISAAGQYGLASQLASVGMLLATEVNRSLTPEYGKAIHGGQSEEQRLSRIVRFQRLVSIAVFAVTAIFGAFFILLIAPQAYEPALGWVVVLCAGYLMQAWYYPPMNILSITQGRTGRMPFITVTSACVNVGANLLLIERFGAVVCAYTTVAGYMTMLVLTSIYAGRHPVLRWGAAAAVSGVLGVVALVGLGTAIVVR